jgi:hypothetical protein
MDTVFECVHRVLHEVCVLEHLTVLPGCQRGVDEPACAPFIAWTHKHACDKLASFYDMTVTSFRGDLEWTFYTINECRYVLLPSRVVEWSDAQACKGYLSAIRELSHADPELGARANADLRPLFEHIRLNWIKTRGEHGSEVETSKNWVQFIFGWRPGRRSPSVQFYKRRPAGGKADPGKSGAGSNGTRIT